MVLFANVAMLVCASLFFVRTRIDAFSTIGPIQNPTPERKYSLSKHLFKVLTNLRLIRIALLFSIQPCRPSSLPILSFV